MNLLIFSYAMFGHARVEAITPDQLMDAIAVV